MAIKNILVIPYAKDIDMCPSFVIENVMDHLTSNILLLDAQIIQLNINSN